jgi:nicotinate-nucleotide adenylyltransferase
MNRERIGLFGGTFNPIHFGHLRAAELVYDRMILDKILFIPSFIPPHKENRDVVSPRHRMEMIKLTLSAHPFFMPSAIEIEAGGTSYSIQTLTKIRKIYSRADLYFILGIDAFLEIETWKDYKRVLEQCRFIIISRPDYILKEALDVLNGAFADKMLEISDKRKVSQQEILSADMLLLKIPSLPISSTDIRMRLRKGKSIKGLVTEDVEDYIHKNHLYQDAQ